MNISIASYEGKENIKKMIDLACLFSEGRHGIYIREVIQNTGVSNYRKIGQNLGMTPAQFAAEVGKFFGSAERVLKWTFASLSRWISNGAMFLGKFRLLGFDKSSQPKAKGFWSALESDKTPQGEFFRAFYKPLLSRDRYLKTQDMFAQAYALFEGVPAEKLADLKERALKERDWTIPYGYLKALAAEAKPAPAKPTADAVAALYADNPIFACLAKVCGAPAVANWFTKTVITHSPETGEIVIAGTQKMPMAIDRIRDKYGAALKALEAQFGCKVRLVPAPKENAPVASPARTSARPQPKAGRDDRAAGPKRLGSFFAFAPPGA